MPRADKPSALVHRTSADGVAAGGAAVSPGATASSVGLDFDTDPGVPWSEWTHVPEAVRATLTQSGVAPHPIFVAGAVPPRVKRRGEDYLQRASAWAIGPTTLMLVEAHRQLERSKGNKFRPVGPWILEVQRQRVIGQPRRRTGSVPADPPGHSDGGGPAGFASADDVLSVADLLPSVVRKQILATVHDPIVEHEYLWRHSMRDRPYRHDAGYIRADEQTAIAVLAEREVGTSRLQTARSAEHALDRATWTVTTLTVQLDSTERIALEASSAALPSSSPRPQLGRP